MIHKTEYTLSLALEEITKEMDTIIGEEVHNLYADLIDVGTAVYDTGAFKRGFIAPTKVGKHGWEFSNTADHSVILAQGRHTINGKAYGSLNWHAGLTPMLAKTDAIMEKRFKEVKA